MTADLVTRLRGWLDEDTPIGVIMNEAAARIEALEAESARLREALEAVVRYAGNGGDDYLADKARAALEGK